MREIKFRGKRIDNGEWIYGGYYNEMIIHSTYMSTEVDPSTVGQYTGLKDKNGKEIYEGDRCELEVIFPGVDNGIYQEPSSHVIHTGIVTYTPSKGYWLKIEKTFDLDEQEEVAHPKGKDIVQYRITLIGNIHDTREGQFG